jgi:type I restriction enzyme M protein
MPIMGLLFLRQATNRHYAAFEAIEADKAAGRMPKRPQWRRTSPDDAH